MRKFAMTLLLGLEMATASFAGGVETTNTAEAEKAEAPKVCKIVHHPDCGELLACGATGEDASALALEMFTSPGVYC
jgi:hypothetical protein